MTFDELLNLLKKHDVLKYRGVIPGHQDEVELEFRPVRPSLPPTITATAPGSIYTKMESFEGPATNEDEMLFASSSFPYGSFVGEKSTDGDNTK